MKKVIIFFIALLLFISPAKADGNEEVTDIFKEFINLYNDNNKEMYNLVHSENQEINNYIDITRGKVNIKIGKYIDVIDSSVDQVTLGMVINADGRTHNAYWSVKNQYTYFIFLKENGKFVLYDTDFFRNTQIDELNQSFNTTVLRMLLAALVAFITIMTIVLLIVNVLIAKQEKKYLENNKTKK